MTPEQLLQLRDDPLLAMKILMPNEKLPPHQQQMLVDMWRAEYSYGSCGRSVGKTAVLAIFAALWGALNPGSKILVLGLKFGTGKLCLEFVEGLCKRNPELAKCIRRTGTGDYCVHGNDAWKIAFMNASEIKTVPSDIARNGARVRGLRCSVLIIDEAAFIPQSILRGTFKPCASVRDQYGRRKVIQMTTGGYRPSEAYEECKLHYRMVKAGNPEYAFFNYCYEDVAAEFSYIIDQKAIEQLKLTSTPAEVAMEIYGQWVEAGQSYYSATMLEKNRLFAVEREVLPEEIGEPGAVYVVGVDPSGSGMDETAISVLKRLASGKWAVVNSFAINYKKGWLENNARLLLEYIERFNPAYIAMDKNGGGEQLAYELRTYFIDRPDQCPIPMDAEPHERGSRIIRFYKPSGAGDDNNTKLNIRLLRALDGNGEPSLLLPGSATEDHSTLLEHMDKLVRQLIHVTAVPLPSNPNLYKFDSPTKKDRFSALLYGWNCAEELVEGETDFAGANDRDASEDFGVAVMGQVIHPALNHLSDSQVLRLAAMVSVNGGWGVVS